LIGSVLKKTILKTGASTKERTQPALGGPQGTFGEGQSSAWGTGENGHQEKREWSHRPRRGYGKHDNWTGSRKPVRKGTGGKERETKRRGCHSKNAKKN